MPKDKLEDMKLNKDVSTKKDYNEIAKNVIDVISKSKPEEQFSEFTDFLGSFLEMNIEKFGEPVIINHLDNIKLMLQLKQTGVIKVKKE